VSVVDSTVQVAEGVGKLLRFVQRSINGSNVQIQGVHTEEPALDSYILSSGIVLLTTAASHVLQLMAGATKNVYVRRIQVWQVGLATAAAIDEFQLVRLTTAGTGGTVVTPKLLDATDAAVGATGMTLPTVKGAEGNILFDRTALILQTLPTALPPGEATKILDFDFTRERLKGIRITAGAANGLALKNIAARAVGSVLVEATFTEANF
jgi:hypothetical protein